MNEEYDKLTQQGGINRFGDSENYIQVGPQGELDVYGSLAIDFFRNLIKAYTPIRASVPATAGSPGTAGTIAYESGFLYVCVATDTWERVAIATWP